MVAGLLQPGGQGVKTFGAVHTRRLPPRARACVTRTARDAMTRVCASMDDTPIPKKQMDPVERARQAIQGAELLPKCIVFDLDNTIWPFFVERVSDEQLKSPVLHPESASVIVALRTTATQSKVLLAAASRTRTPERAAEYLRTVGLGGVFASRQLYYTENHDKTRHMTAIRDELGLTFPQMLLFDDEVQNIVQIGALGVACVLVNATHGVTAADLEAGLARFATHVQRMGGGGTS